MFENNYHSKEKHRAWTALLFDVTFSIELIRQLMTNQYSMISSGISPNELESDDFPIGPRIN